MGIIKLDVTYKTVELVNYDFMCFQGDSISFGKPSFQSSTPAYENIGDISSVYIWIKVPISLLNYVYFKHSHQSPK